MRCMTSINPDINALHAAFCEVTERPMPLNPRFERAWFDAIAFGLTPDMVREVMQSRMRRQYINESMRIHCCSIWHCIANEDRLAQMVDEAHQLAAAKRKKVYAPGKAAVLASTHRATEPEPQPARSYAEILKGLKEAAQ